MKKSFVLLLLMIVSVACTNDNVQDVAVSVGEGEKIYASISAPECRVQLNDGRETVWTAGDQILVVSQDEYALYGFDGNTGDKSGSFTKQQSFAAPSDSYLFDKSYALYSFEGYGAFADGTPALFSRVQSTQSYMKNSYGLMANAMVGSSEDGVNYTFKNVLGYLRLSLVGNKSVSKITVSGNAEEIISGIFYFSIKDFNTLAWYDEKTSAITLDCGAGVALSSAPTPFYFVLPPMTFEQGIRVNVEFTDGTSYTHATKKQIVIERNTIQPMAAFDADVDENDYSQLVINHTGRYIDAPLFVGAVSGEVDWGDGNTSLLHEFLSYDFLDGKESHVVSFKVLGAESFELQSCEGVSTIDLSNF